jgi:SAM-dependent methyltransferase
MAQPSVWVLRFASLVSPGGCVLDVACGAGRHSRLFQGLGHPVTAVDIDLNRFEGSGIERIQADLESSKWPLSDRRFAAVIVTNYLWRPLFPYLLSSLARGGVLLYETFARGNQRFGKPANAAYLLEPGELLELVRNRLHVVAYEHGLVESPRPAAIERICAVNAPFDPDLLTALP